MRGFRAVGMLAGVVPLLGGPCHLSAAEATATEKPLIPVLCLYSEDLRLQGLDHIDARALTYYRSAGFDLQVGCYQTTDAATLARFPVVVGMMPMLYDGTRAIDERLGADLERYIRAGGGFALLPAPSYYGGRGFTRQLNPWLHGFGAELLNEQPRDPDHQQLLTRIIGYRYLSTTNIAPHPVTDSLSQLWLPIDYTDAYVLTHTMRLSPDWQVLIRGNLTCVTHPLDELSAGRATLGSYTSAPPFLAVRPWGAGRMALFTTSSQYFIFDAYHWAFGDGFVMQTGGETLMANLLKWLAANASPGEPPTAPPSAGPAVVTGNVACSSSKADWFNSVRRLFTPDGSHPVAYVDCGAMSDLPYSPERGKGWTDTRSWPVRWSWSEVFHPTAANARAFSATPLTYRFDSLKPDGAYTLGLLRWAYAPQAARPMQVNAGPRPVAASLATPRFADRQGPRLDLFPIPAAAVTPDGRLDLTFSMTNGAQDTFASVGEIWIFEQGGANPPDAFARLLAEQNLPPRTLCEPGPMLKPFHGLIGADAGNTVKPARISELGHAARLARYDFLAFLSDASLLDATTLATYQKACADASDDSFRCLPGVSFSAGTTPAARRPDAPTSWGLVRAYVLQHVSTLPTAAECEQPYSLFWSFLSGARTGGQGIAPTLRTPGANAISPFYQRFWRGFDVVTAGDAGAPNRDARELYQDLMAAGYGPQPRAAGAYATPASITAARQPWATTIFAPNLAHLEDHQYTACVGNGPRFNTYYYSFDYGACGNAGEGLLFNGNAWIVLHADIEAASDIESATLMSGATPIRVWHPRQPRLKLEEPIRVARNHELWMRVRCADGTEAMTGRHLAEDRSFMAAMCSDNQNTICSLAAPPQAFVRDDRDLFLSHSYWHTGEAGGQLGAMRRMTEIVPRVIETGIVQPIKHFKPCPVLYLADGSTENHIQSELRLLGASSEFNQTEYRFDTPLSRARSRVLLTTYRPALNGDTTVLVETTLEAKTNLTFRTGQPGLQHLAIAPLRELAPAWTYTYLPATGALETGAFDYTTPEWSRTAALSPDGGVMLWPSDIGSLLVLPLDGTSYEMALSVLPAGNGRELVTLTTHPEAMTAGQQVTSRFLVVLHQGAVTSAQQLTDLRARCAEASTCVQAVTEGRLADGHYALTLEATNQAIRIAVDTRTRRDPLPIALRGVVPQWPCGVLADGALRLLEAVDTTLRFVVAAGTPGKSYAAGNLVLCDHPEVRMEWTGIRDGQVGLHLHNPTTSPIRARIRTNPLLRELPPLDAVCEIPAGTSVWARGSGANLEAQ
ncbi:MAG: hypothetical protein K8T26_06410 [Lentisphaerae bacterium]|nr:hypothetical protein [Lentisphaerota bacterium]